MEKLTKKQKEVLEKLIEFQEKEGYTPTMRELGKAVGLSSSATIFVHLLNLEQKGYIKRISNRLIIILKNPSKVTFA